MTDWIDVNIELPKDEEKVLCCTTTAKGTQNIVTGYYSKDMERWVCGMNSNVTHWMKPDLPGKKKSYRENLLECSEYCSKEKCAKGSCPFYDSYNTLTCVGQMIEALAKEVRKAEAEREEAIRIINQKE